MNKIQVQDMLDADGQNLAVRSFLMIYSCDHVIRISEMMHHMEISGWGGMWPEVVSDAKGSENLTKAYAQVWIRYLFSLEI